MIHRKKELKFAWLIIFLTGMSFFSFAQITLTIEEAMDIAEDNNPRMRTTKLNYERTQYQLEEQRARLKPQFSMTLNPFGYSQNRRFDNFNSEYYTGKNLSTGGRFQTVLPFLPTDGTLRLTNNFSWNSDETQKATGKTLTERFVNNLQLRYDQPIFTYNTLKMDIQRLEYDRENAGISYALQRLTTEQSITRQFYAVYTAKNDLAIYKEELENSLKNYEITKSKAESLLSAKDELWQAELNLADAQSSVQSREVFLANAKDALKQTLGMPLSEDIDISVEIVATPMIIDVEKAVYAGLTSRIELRQREINIELEELRLITVSDREKFKGNISLAVGVTGDDPKFADIYSTPTSSPSISISFEVPIFDWGQRKARINAQKTAQTIARYMYEDEKVNIESDIRSTLRNLENYRYQISIAETQVRNAEQTYKLNEIRYREGDVTSFQMSQFQSQLSSQKQSIVSAQIAYKQELLNLKIATLYDFENDKPIVPIKELKNITIR
jgi:outer membrane protein TolC